jgi:carboxypeptidase C (cathepsin A)
VPADLVDQIPGFDKTVFNVYSGYLAVPGPINGYDALRIHYQLHLSQGDPATSPVVAWHQGGPGGSSTQGGMIEMGYFQVADEIKVNPHAWNQVANMLYLESPAGSGGPTGFSQCLKGGKPVACSWDDVTQGEAYGHTLLAFFKAYPELAKNDFYLAGESYFGQYGPNIAHALLNNDGFSSINLVGLLVGNGCWGPVTASGDYQCNGPNEARNNFDMLYGKGLASKKQHQAVYKACGYASDNGNADSTECQKATKEFNAEVGPFNVYNVYDNCPKPAEYLRSSGGDVGDLLKEARAALAPASYHAEHGLLGHTGGYPWECGGTYPPGKVADFVTREDVRKALHLEEPGLSDFDYNISGPASMTLYPELSRKIHVLIYNGDADMCVPYTGNEEWITDLEDQGVFEQKDAWRPWFSDAVKDAPAGSKTTYSVVGTDMVLQFLTIRLAGHMVPLFTPEAALSFFKNFLAETASTSAKEQPTIV